LSPPVPSWIEPPKVELLCRRVRVVALAAPLVTVPALLPVRLTTFVAMPLRSSVAGVADDPTVKLLNTFNRLALVLLPRTRVPPSTAPALPERNSTLPADSTTVPVSVHEPKRAVVPGPPPTTMLLPVSVSVLPDVAATVARLLMSVAGVPVVVAGTTPPTPMVIVPVTAVEPLSSRVPVEPILVPPVVRLPPA